MAPDATAPVRHTVARPPFERIALLLQGGGALGAYQAGVYQALHEADLAPDWVAGISIGAINSALIAGNAPENRVPRLREFWEMISQPPMGLPVMASIKLAGVQLHQLVNQASAFGTLLFGAPGFFTPRPIPPAVGSVSAPGELSYYDTTALRATLERLVDFDRINDPAKMHFSVGAVDVQSGNFTYFDNATHKIGPEHIMASGALPPGFPPVEAEGSFWWDGGLVSNTPLDWVLGSYPRQDTLAFQVDLWNARGELPLSMVEQDVRQKEIRYSSRTRASTDQFKKSQLLRRAAAKLIAGLPPEMRDTPEARLLGAEADEKVFNIVQLIYRSRKYEGMSKDYEFSRRTMEEHWASGYEDAKATLTYEEVLQRPTSLDGVFTFDLAHAHHHKEPGR